MSTRNLFSPEQIETLRKNPYVYSVTQNRLSFTKEFKEIFLSEYNNGILPRDIFENHGFDTKLLGDRRVWNSSCRIRDEYAQNGCFRDPDERATRKTSQDHKLPTTQLSEADQIKQLQHEVDYLKQEMEFLKKISSIKNTRK